MSNDSENTGPRGKKAKEKDKRDFLVVGIGASAGGIKALREFFAAMPAEPGMAFVVILHLSQQYKSNLPEILQRETKMRVEQVTSTVKVEPNRVYVIPPAKYLEMVDGIIRLKEPERVRGKRVPIDRFFRSLAEAYGRRAVSIILSGTGSDGTLGLKHVKGSNGFAIVQDPQDAEYDGMPLSAIETKIVDVVLPVAAMPEKLLSVRDSTERLRLTDGEDGVIAKEIKNSDALRDVLTLLRVRTGHDFSNYKRPTLIRRVARHLQIHETDDLKEYLEILREKPEEVLSLLKNLLINVTNFFRDKDAFEALEQKIIPAIFEGKTGEDSVRVWIAGCSSGEEAYSVAILLHEQAARLAEPPKVQVFASDVDEDAIAEAREGRYTEAVVADISAARLKQFFIREGDTYRIRKSIREMILFAPHNLLRDPPFSRLDLISCRNVLIYLNRDTQEKVLQVFHFALKENGYLFLGSSESADSVSNSFTAADKKHRIYQRRPSSLDWNAPPDMPLQGTWRARLPEVPHETRRQLQSYGELHHRLVEKYAPPSILVNEEGEILHLSENAGRYLRFVGGEPTANLMKVLHPSLLPDLRAALFAAKQEGKPIDARNVRVKLDGEEKLVNISVRPVMVPDAAALLIFEEAAGESETGIPSHAVVAGDKAMESVVRRLEDELQRTKDHLRNIIEQYETSVEELKASNEEMQAVNEELRSASEELETGKEELQSVNEELTTVNSELKEKIDEVGHANSDLQNLMRSTDIATIFLDRELKIKRYTPAATEIFNLIPGDIGRPLDHITHQFSPDDFAADAVQTLQSLKTSEREVVSKEQCVYLAFFSPYRTVEDKIDGVVLTFVDITQRKHIEESLADDLADTNMLRDLAARLVTEENIQRIYEEILFAAISITRSDAGTVQLYDPETGELILLVTQGFERKMTDHFRRVGADSKTACGFALRTGERTFIDYEDDTEEACRMHIEAGYLSAQSTPLVSRAGTPIGMLNTHWQEAKHRPNERQLRFLDLLARQAADLIEHRQAEAALRESAEQFRRAIEEAPIPVIMQAEDGQVLQISKTWTELTGYSQQDIQNFDAWLNRAYGEGADALRQHMEELFKGRRRTLNIEFPVRTLAGGLRHWSFSASAPGALRDGRRFIIGMAVDVTERKAAEETLRESEERLRLMMESVTDFAILTMDTEGRITSWNTGAEHLFGYTEKEAIGQHAALIFTPEDRQRGEPDREMKNAREQGRAADERWHLRKNGERFYVSGVLAPLRDGDRVTGYVKIARDLTEQQKAAEALKRAHDELEDRVRERTQELAEANGSLRGEIAERVQSEQARLRLLRQLITVQEEERRRIARELHDTLGQQLAALRMSIELIKSEWKHDARLQEHIERTQSIFSQLDSDVDFLAWELRPAQLDQLGLDATLRTFVREWSEHFQIEADYHGFGEDAPRLIPEVETNLYRILQEALQNVNKHAGATRVSVVLERRNGRVVLIVEDNGKGYDPNQKVAAGSNKGMGVTNMRERASLIGGEVEIESTPGAGTAIYVFVPVIEQEEKEI